MTIREINEELAAKGKKLQYVGTTWQRGYISRKDALPDEESTAYPANKKCKYYADFYVLAPSWKSTQYCHRNYYKIVDI